MWIFVIIELIGVVIAFYGQKKKGPIQPFEGITEKILQKYTQMKEHSSVKMWIKVLLQMEKVEKKIRLVQVGAGIEQKVQTYYKKKLKIVFGILLLGNSIALAVSVQQHLEAASYQEVERASYGEGSREENLQAEISGKGGEGKTTVTLEVNEQQYTDAQIEELFEKAKKELEEVILGENKSLDKVSQKLNFVAVLQDGVVEVQYEPEDYELIDSKGEILLEERPEEGTLTEITAVFSYQERTYEYTFGVCIIPKVFSEEEHLKQSLKKEITKKDQESRYLQVQKLPQKVEGSDISWTKEKSNIAVFLLLLAMVLAGVIFYATDKDLDKERQARERQMMLDYPEIVNKLTLLIGAGMTIFGAWKRMVEEYKKRGSKREKRYAYEEMVLTFYEIRDGVSEFQAYEHFGTRCALQKYKKLGTLLSQNLKKGSQGLSGLLAYEAEDAFEERKNLAKRIGEEAGTKMIGPMFLMLGIVMVIIMVPALLSFQM